MIKQIEALKAAGVTEVVLAINHQQPEVLTTLFFPLFIYPLRSDDSHFFCYLF